MDGVYVGNIRNKEFTRLDDGIFDNKVHARLYKYTNMTILSTGKTVSSAMLHSIKVVQQFSDLNGYCRT